MFMYNAINSWVAPPHDEHHVPEVTKPTTLKEIEEAEQPEHDHAKEENKLIQVLEKARMIYTEKELVGTISITRSFTYFYRNVSCDIDGAAEKMKMQPIGNYKDALINGESQPESTSHSELAAESHPIQEGAHKEATGTDVIDTGNHLSYFERMIMALVSRCIRSLQRRAKPYQKKDYKSTLMLTNTIYAVMPFFGLFSVNVSCTATAASLNAATAREKK